MDISLEYCRVFYHVARSGSITLAARQLCISQPAVSQSIRQLEQQLGFPVVQRWAGGSGGGGSVLTENGEKLLDSYEKMVAEIQDFTDQAYQKYMGKEFIL